MIECCDYNLIKKGRKKGFKKFLSFFLFAIIVSSVFCYYRFVVTENVLIVCEDYSLAYSTESVNKAVMLGLSDSIEYSDLMQIDRNVDGDIACVTANAYKINLINKKIEKEAMRILSKKLNDGIPVPLLAFTGIGVISGYGRTVDFKTIAVSDVYCTFSGKFESAGINQTIHRIFIDVNTTVNIDVPFNKRTKSFTNSVLVSEAILIGKVPEIYLNGKII